MKRKFLAVFLSAAMALTPVAGQSVIASEPTPAVTDVDDGVGLTQGEDGEGTASHQSTGEEAVDGVVDGALPTSDDHPQDTENMGKETSLSEEAAKGDDQNLSSDQTEGESSTLDGNHISTVSDTDTHMSDPTADKTSEENPDVSGFDEKADETGTASASDQESEAGDAAPPASDNESEAGKTDTQEESFGDAAEDSETNNTAPKAEADMSEPSLEEQTNHLPFTENEVPQVTLEETAKQVNTLEEAAPEEEEKPEVISVMAINLPNRYVLRSVAKSNLAMETVDGKRASGANVQIATNNKYNRQSYVFEATDEVNVYKIKNSGTGMYLTVDDSSVVQGSEGSAFLVSKKSKGGKNVYTFQEVDSGKVLSVYGDAENGADVVISDNEGDDTQLWYVTRNDSKAGLETGGEDAGLLDGYYQISLTGDKSARMAVKTAGIGEALNVQIDKSYATDGEYWYIKALGNGLYTIKAFCSSKVLTAEKETVESLMNVYQSKDTGAINQKWYIRKSTVNEGAYVICSAADPNFVVGTYGSGVKNGSNIRMYLSASADNRRWTITSVTSPKEGALADGTYYFASRLTYKRALSVKDESNKEDANVQLSLKMDTKGERWKIKSLGYGNIYRVTNNKSGLALASESGAKGANILQKTYNKSETMLWRIMPIKSGANVYYRIISLANEQALIVKDNNKKAGTNILLGKQASAKGQQWEAVKAVSSPAKYTNISLRSIQDNTLFVSMATGSPSDDKKIIIDEGSKKELTKTFYISPVARDVYQIKCVGSGKYLTVYNSKTSNNAAVVQAAWENLDSQKWTIEKYDSGYRFKNVGSEKYLTIKDGKIKDGTNLVIYSEKTDKSQIFSWTTASPVTNGWTTLNGHRAYVSKSVIQIDKFIDNGKYYVDQNGYIYTGWKKYNRYYYYYVGSNGYANDTRPYLNDLFGTRKSKYGGYTCPDCDYYITVNTSYPCMATVYTMYPGTDYFNTPVFAFLVSPGTDSTPTDSGSRMTGGNQRWKALMGPSWGQYSTEALLYTTVSGVTTWYCNGEYFHSVACSEANTHNLNPGTYNLLGTKQSHGCIRCPVRYSYWIYEYVPYGSDMYVGSNCARPIAHVPIPYAIGSIDPTDPNYTGNWGYTDSNQYVSGYWSGYIDR